MAGTKTWTNDEVAIIKNNANLLTDLEIFALLSNINSDKTFKAMLKKRQRLGLGKKRGQSLVKRAEIDKNAQNLQ